MDWYYKRPDENGKLRLHYCKLCNGVVLYASQNDPALAARGLYDHGKYPFVFDPLFVEEDSPAGFGYIDVMKDCQNAIDKMNHAMDENVLLASRQRYVLSDTAGVNEEELADLSRDIVHVVGRLNEDSFPSAANGGPAGQQPELPQQPHRGAEGDQRQPRPDAGRHQRRRDRRQRHRCLAGGGQQAEPGYAQERLPRLCKAVLPHY